MRALVTGAEEASPQGVNHQGSTYSGNGNIRSCMAMGSPGISTCKNSGTSGGRPDKQGHAIVIQTKQVRHTWGAGMPLFRLGAYRLAANKKAQGNVVEWLLAKGTLNAELPISLAEMCRRCERVESALPSRGGSV